MRKMYLLPALGAIIDRAPSTVLAKDSGTRHIVPNVVEMMGLAPDESPLGQTAGSALFGPPCISGRGFRIYAGWPDFLNGNSVHGGMLVDKDGDREIVVCTSRESGN